MLQKNNTNILTLPRRRPSSVIDKYLWLVRPSIINKLVPTEWNSRLPVEEKDGIGNGKTSLSSIMHGCGRGGGVGGVDCGREERSGDWFQMSFVTFVTFHFFVSILKTIRLRARVFYEQIVNKAQLSLVENEGQ